MPEVNIPERVVARRQTRTYDTQSDNSQEMFDSLAALMPPSGTLLPTVAATEPSDGGYKLCNGQALLKAEFPRLYALIGGTYGETADTFNLPDLRGRMLYGAPTDDDLQTEAGSGTITLTIDQLPAHAHGITDAGHTHNATSQAHNHTVTDPGHDHLYNSTSGSGSLPAGGTEGQVLVKQSDSDGDADWESIVLSGGNA